MSFSTDPDQRIKQVFDRSDKHCLDPVVRVTYLPKGKNIIFGSAETVVNDPANLILLGKVLEQSPGTNYLSSDAWLDVSFPHVVYITGTRGSGKSFDLGILLEGIARLSGPSQVQQKIVLPCSILIDTQSQFWTLKYEPREHVPQHHQQLKQLSSWGIKANSLSDCVLFIPPHADKITGDETVFHLKPSDVLHEEWCEFFGEEVYSPQGYALGLALEELGDTNFQLQDLIAVLQDPSKFTNVPEASKNALCNKLSNLQRSGVFSSVGIDVKALLKPGRCNVFMLRDLRDADKSLVTAVIARQLFSIMGRYHTERKASQFFGTAPSEEELPSKVWLMIDEAHVVAPSEGYSPAKAALIEYVKRGRDAGLSLVLATQQPSAVANSILSQVNISLSHRLTFQNDISSSMQRIPTKVVSRMKSGGTEVSDFGDMLRYLESGECFIGDHNTSRTILLKMRPRITAHGGYSPI